MPLYANTLTETSGTGLQTTHFREDARKIIHKAVGGSDEDLIIFCGSGAAAAINKVIDILSLDFQRNKGSASKFLTIYQRKNDPSSLLDLTNTSNELPWRESLAEVDDPRDL